METTVERIEVTDLKDNTYFALIYISIGDREVTIDSRPSDAISLALRTTLEENLAMVRDTVAFLRAEGRRVFVDCEHYFDGYRENPGYAE